MLSITISSIIVLGVFHCEAFLLGSGCLAPSPCTCSGSGSSYAYINCNSKSLNTTPHFMKADRQVSTLNVRLYRNHLTTIPSYAFKNLSNVNATSVSIDLNNNKISVISRYAFSGIENVTTELMLRENNLSSIPEAFYNFHNLKTLDLLGNPLKSLGVLAKSNLGNTLQTFSVDLKEFLSWPTELRFLRALKSLTIYNMNLPHLSSDAFLSFETSLTSLDIRHATNFVKIPNAVCQCSNLNSLTLLSFSNLKRNGTSIFDHCTARLNKVTNLYLQSNKLTKFPDVFHIFPALTQLHLLGNSLKIIESEKVPANNVLTYIDLDSNMFQRIPNALNRFKSLQSLDLRNNDIFSVEDHDLSSLTKLQTLYLMYNPITYISSHAFQHNKALSTLDLTRTSLQTVPAAVTFLPNLSYFKFVDIPCTCEMSYLKGWNATAVRTFNGDCAYSGIKIQRFIMSSLQNCP